MAFIEPMHRNTPNITYLLECHGVINSSLIFKASFRRRMLLIELCISKDVTSLRHMFPARCDIISIMPLKTTQGLRRCKQHPRHPPEQ